MSSDLPGFDFESIKPTTVSEAAKAMGKAMGQHKIVEISSDGVVKIHGYHIDEVIKLLEAYRQHMIEFGQGMQSLAQSADAVTYRPEGGAYR